MADVFVSYTKDDRGVAEAVVHQLRSMGRTVWWDDDLPGGAKFRMAIRRELDLARCVMVIWSPRSVESDFVQSEAEVARRQGKLVSLRTSDLVADQLPLGFDGYHALLVSDTEGVRIALQRFLQHQTTESPTVADCNMFTFNAETGKLTRGIARAVVAGGSTDNPHSFRSATPDAISAGDLLAIDVGDDEFEDFVFADPGRPPIISGQNFYAGDAVVGFGNDGKRRPHIVSATRASAALVLVISGQIDPGALESHRLHGAISFEGGDSLIAGSPLSRLSHTIRRSLWRLPVGAILFVKSYSTGKLARLVATQEGVSQVDATGYEEVFKELVTKIKFR